MKTFINQNVENSIVEDGEKHLAMRKADLKFFQHYNCTDESDFLNKLDSKDLIIDFSDLEELKDIIQKFEDLPAFYDYGLGFDYVELGTFNNQYEDYFRYQLSFGGPSEEIRFYEDGTTEFVYLDWFSGVGFDITSEDFAEFLREQFEELGMLDFGSKREETDYYSKIIDKEF